MEKQEMVRVAVGDLGQAAYAKLKNFKCVGRKGRVFYFDVNASRVEDLEDTALAYLNSVFHDFDACIMSMKKLSERLSNPGQSERKTVSDLGASAYLRLHGFVCAGRRGRNIYFEVSSEDASRFNAMIYDYCNSEFHEFDSAIMSLKKMPDTMGDD